MRDRLAWLVFLAVAVFAVIGISFAAVGLSVASSPPESPLPASLTLTGPPPAEASPSVDFQVVPSPSIDLTEDAADDADDDKGQDEAGGVDNDAGEVDNEPLD
jgi:hypothetical protein